MTAKKLTIDQLTNEVRQRYSTLDKSEKRWINTRVEEIMFSKHGIKIDQQDRELWISARRTKKDGSKMKSVHDLEFALSYAVAFEERLALQNLVFEKLTQQAEA